MKLRWKREIFAMAILVTMAIVAIFYYPMLPGIVASHFDSHGKPNGWMAKTTYLVIMGSTVVFIYLSLTFLPLIDPLKKKIEVKFRNILFFRDIFLMFFALIFFISLEAAREKALNVNLFGIALGSLFIVVGNYLPKVPQNWFVGIRTPWTISSEVVWKRTHIVGGWLFILSGAFYIICVALKVDGVIILWVAILIPLISVPYSFFLYKKNEKDGT